MEITHRATTEKTLNFQLHDAQPKRNSWTIFVWWIKSGTNE